MQRNLDTHFLPPNHVGEKTRQNVGLWNNAQVVKDNVLNIVPQSWSTVGVSHDVEKPHEEGGFCSN
jgi:hypothetical protein